MMLEHYKHRVTRPAGLGSRPVGPISRLLGASSTLDDAISIAGGRSPTEKPGYGIVWVPYVRFYPLAVVRRYYNLMSDCQAAAWYSIRGSQQIPDGE